MLNFAEAQPSHYQELEELAAEIWTEHYTPIIGRAQVSYMLDKFQNAEAIAKQIADGAEYFLMQEDKKTIGYFSYQKRDGALFLSKIYLLKDARGKGFGKQAISFIAEKAKNKGLKSIALTVNKYNYNSIKAYEKMGFVTLRELVADIGEGYVMDDYWMELSVGL